MDYLELTEFEIDLLGDFIQAKHPYPPDSCTTLFQKYVWYEFLLPFLKNMAYPVSPKLPIDPIEQVFAFVYQLLYPDIKVQYVFSQHPNQGIVLPHSCPSESIFVFRSNLPISSFKFAYILCFILPAVEVKQLPDEQVPAVFKTLNFKLFSSSGVVTFKQLGTVILQPTLLWNNVNELPAWAYKIFNASIQKIYSEKATHHDMVEHLTILANLVRGCVYFPSTRIVIASRIPLTLTPNYRTKAMLGFNLTTQMDGIQSAEFRSSHCLLLDLITRNSMVDASQEAASLLKIANPLDERARNIQYFLNGLELGDLVKLMAEKNTKRKNRDLFDEFYMLANRLDGMDLRLGDLKAGMENRSRVDQSHRVVNKELFLFDHIKWMKSHILGSRIDQSWVSVRGLWGILLYCEGLDILEFYKYLQKETVDGLLDFKISSCDAMCWAQVSESEMLFFRFPVYNWCALHLLLSCFTEQLKTDELDPLNVGFNKVKVTNDRTIVDKLFAELSTLRRKLDTLSVYTESGKVKQEENVYSTPRISRLCNRPGTGMQAGSNLTPLPLSATELTFVTLPCKSVRDGGLGSELIINRSKKWIMLSESEQLVYTLFAAMHDALQKIDYVKVSAFVNLTRIHIDQFNASVSSGYTIQDQTQIRAGLAYLFFNTKMNEWVVKDMIENKHISVFYNALSTIPAKWDPTNNNKWFALSVRVFGLGLSSKTLDAKKRSRYLWLEKTLLSCNLFGYGLTDIVKRVMDGKDKIDIASETEWAFALEGLKTRKSEIKIANPTLSTLFDMANVTIELVDPQIEYKYKNVDMETQKAISELKRIAMDKKKKMDQTQIVHVLYSNLTSKVLSKTEKESETKGNEIISWLNGTHPKDYANGHAFLVHLMYALGLISTEHCVLLYNMEQGDDHRIHGVNRIAQLSQNQDLGKTQHQVYQDRGLIRVNAFYYNVPLPVIPLTKNFMKHNCSLFDEASMAVYKNGTHLNWVFPKYFTEMIEKGTKLFEQLPVIEKDKEVGFNKLIGSNPFSGSAAGIDSSLVEEEQGSEKLTAAELDEVQLLADEQKKGIVNYEEAAENDDGDQEPRLKKHIKVD